MPTAYIMYDFYREYAMCIDKVCVKAYAVILFKHIALRFFATFPWCSNSWGLSFARFFLSICQKWNSFCQKLNSISQIINLICRNSLINSIFAAASFFIFAPSFIIFVPSSIIFAPSCIWSLSIVHNQWVLWTPQPNNVEQLIYS